VVPTRTEPIPKPIYIPNVIKAEPILKQPITLVDVLVVKLAIPPDIVKQHLLETFFHLEVRKMIVDGTPT
jgi:hypothetical protein